MKIAQSGRVSSGRYLYRLESGMIYDVDDPFGLVTLQKEQAKASRPGNRRPRTSYVLKATIRLEPEYEERDPYQKQTRLLEAMLANQHTLWGLLIEYFSGNKSPSKFVGGFSSTDRELREHFKYSRNSDRYPFLEEMSVLHIRWVIQTFAIQAHKDNRIPATNQCPTWVSFYQDCPLCLDLCLSPQKGDWMWQFAAHHDALLTIPKLGTVRLFLGRPPTYAKKEPKGWESACRKVVRVTIFREEPEEKPVRWVVVLHFSKKNLPAKNRKKPRSLLQAERMPEGCIEFLEEAIKLGQRTSSFVDYVMREYELSKATVYRTVRRLKVELASDEAEAEAG